MLAATFLPSMIFAVMLSTVLGNAVETGAINTWIITIPVFRKRGSDSKLVKRQHSCPQKFTASPAIHGAFHCFQSVDLPLDLPTTPQLRNGILDGVRVTSAARTLVVRAPSKKHAHA